MLNSANAVDMAASSPARAPATYRDGTFLADVARVCGGEVASKIAEAYAGVRIYVPAEPKPDSVLANLIGLEAARTISREVGFGEFPALPSLNRENKRTSARRLLLNGASVNQVARQVGCTSRHVFSVRAELRREGAL